MYYNIIVLDRTGKILQQLFSKHLFQIKLQIIYNIINISLFCMFHTTSRSISYHRKVSLHLTAYKSSHVTHLAHWESQEYGMKIISYKVIYIFPYSLQAAGNLYGLQRGPLQCCFCFRCCKHQ